MTSKPNAASIADSTADSARATSPAVEVFAVYGVEPDAGDDMRRRFGGP